MIFDPAVMKMLLVGIWETILIVFGSTLAGYMIGLPLGVILVVTRKGGVHPVPVLNSVLGFIINLLRSVPFIILLVIALPYTRKLVGTSLGVKAIIPSLVVASAPYIARVVESELAEVDNGVIEAAKSMGASDWQIIWKVMLPETKPSLILGAALVLTTIIGYSCMTGFVGGGGLGDLAIRYGYYRYQADIMYASVILLVIIVQIIQGTGDRISLHTDKRIR